MKTIVLSISLLGIFVLSGCSTISSHQRDNRGYIPPSQDVTQGDKISVKHLSPEALKVLTNEMGDDWVVAITVKPDGSIGLVGVPTHKRVRHIAFPTERTPIPTTGITGFSSINILKYKGSQCYMLIPPYVHGGTLHSGIEICF